METRIPVERLDTVMTYLKEGRGKVVAAFSEQAIT
jgi:hypothetical protein